MAKRIIKGLFISFEGIEGCGKTTQAKRLAAFLRRKGFPVVLTSEPGGTPLSNAIRRLLLKGSERVAPQAELMLFLASRAQLVQEVIKPALHSGKIVICDRYADSTTAYQGYGRGMPLKWLGKLNDTATSGVWPQVTFLLDVSVTEGLKRVGTRWRGRDRIERERLVFHRRVAEGYRCLAVQHPGRFRVVPVQDSVSKTEEFIRDGLPPFLKHPSDE